MKWHIFAFWLIKKNCIYLWPHSEHLYLFTRTLFLKWLFFAKTIYFMEETKTMWNKVVPLYIMFTLMSRAIWANKNKDISQKKQWCKSTIISSIYLKFYIRLKESMCGLIPNNTKYKCTHKVTQKCVYTRHLKNMFV